LETAIEVAGLRPGHFYNVRVIAVGSNNFQAGSRVIRLRTLGPDQRPMIGDSKTPPDTSSEEQQDGENGDERLTVRLNAATEPAHSPESSLSMTREPSSGQQGQRRNTGNAGNTAGRRHSPSTAAADQAALANILSNHSDESMHELTEKFEGTRKETEEVLSQISKDYDEFKMEMNDLTKDRDEKKHILKEKEEASEKLKKMHYSERLNRQAQNKKSQKEKALKDKQAERTRMYDDMARWKKGIGDWKEERQVLQREGEEYEKLKEAKVEELRVTIRKRQDSLTGLEEVIRVKGLQIKELEEERKNLPGAEDDDESRERDAKDREADLAWEKEERELSSQLIGANEQLRGIHVTIAQNQPNYNSLLARQANNPLMYHANSSGVDFDTTGGQGKAKSRRGRNRKSRTNTISSPVAGYPILDSPFPSAAAYNNLHSTASPTFAQGPYFDMNNDTAMVPLSEHMSGMSEADVRAMTAGAPLSPTATSLLPSNIFNDDEFPSPRVESSGSFGPILFGNTGPSTYDNDPQSPDSSSRSASLMSSPQTSSHNLAMYGVSGRDYAMEADRRSLTSPRMELSAVGSPAGPEQSSSYKGFGNLFIFQKARSKTMNEDGHALGTLKQGQSQSFPRTTEEPETMASRHRRISFSASWNAMAMPSFLQRNSAGEAAPEGNAPAPARNPGARRRRGFNMFGGSTDEAGIYSERDPSSPRPVSIASSDLPRPSTDSAPFGWAPAQDSIINRNSPLATNWSVNAPQTWSTNASRRPSIQHGSTTALTTGLATEDDEFLPPTDTVGQASPASAIGVIGTRPVSSHKPITPKLNPAAPAFKGFGISFNRSSKPEKEKDKAKSKEIKPLENATSANEPQNTNFSSPAESRKSRDTPSIHTQNSVAESQDSLERVSSNTPSEMNTPSGNKDKESSFRQLLRKGSSSKFSISSFRNKESGLFSSGKKAGSSAANSDRNASVERDGSFDENREDAGLGKSADSLTSSPMIGSIGSGEWKAKDKDSCTPKEGRMSMTWGRFGIKKSKARESLDVDRSEAETTGTDDDEL
jgi:hypothetical protein